MLSLDPVTQAAYDAFSAAADRAQAILDVMTGTISVRVYEGSTLVGQGTMASPWAVRSGDTLTVGESTAFQVLQDGDPDPGAWSLRFENPDGRWVRGTFGLYGSDADFRWRREDSNAPAPWRTGQYGSIGVAVANALDASGYGGPVTGLVATVNSSTSVTLNWNAYAGATSYQVRRGTSAGSLTLVNTITGSPPATTWTNTGHTAATTYYYRVDAMSGSTTLAQSAVVSATTQAAPGAFNPGNPLFFDDFDYTVTNNPANAAANSAAFAAAGWSGAKALNCVINSGAAGNLYTTDVAAIPGHSGAAPGSVQRALCINALPLTFGTQTDFYLQYGSTLGDIPPNVWFQFWLYPCRSGAQMHKFGNRDKFLYPTRNTYPVTINNGMWLVELGQTNAWEMDQTAPVSSNWGQDAGVGSGFLRIDDTQVLTSRPYYGYGAAYDSSTSWKLGQDLNERIVPNRWTLVKIHIDTSQPTGTYEVWLRPRGQAWVKVADWRAGVSPPTFQWNIEAAYRDGHAAIRMPTTVPGPGSETPSGDWWLYMQDYAMASTEAALPTYG